MAIQSLVLATRNPHKLREFARLLEPAGIAIEPLPADIELPPEDGSTFEETVSSDSSRLKLRSPGPSPAGGGMKPATR